MRRPGTLAGVVAALVCLAPSLRAATKTVQVGPDGALVFRDEESGTNTTTITAGDTVEWVWMSSGHSSTRTDTPKMWDSGIQNMPFMFSQSFASPGRYPYHCTPHEFLGMVGTVVVEPAAGGTTTTTLPSSQGCTDAEAVAAVRAQVDARCPCVGAAHHRAYVRCAVAVAQEAVTTGRLPKACKAAVKHCAAKSTCGRPGFVTCCRSTLEGGQTCGIKPSAVACKVPKGGTACVGDQPSCCDACGGATCPPPATSTTSTSTTLGPTTPTGMPAGSSSTTTTSTQPPLLECLADADCPAGNVCDGFPRCLTGVCVAGAPQFCPDGTPALWVGTASSFTGFVDLEFAICAADGFVSGTFACLSDFLPCFAVESPIFGSTGVSVDGVTILFAPFVFATGETCTFDGLLVGLTMGGEFVCVDPFGFVVSAGTWNASRCP
jgi:plastocyanin